MAAAESLTITRKIDDRLEIVDDTVRGVDHKVGSVIEGESVYRISPPPNFSQLCVARCKGNRSSDSRSRQSSH